MTICRGHFLGLTILICTSLIACSKPTKPLSPNEIVEALLDLPPYPSPPLTEENASNESYQAVVRECNVADYLLLGYRSKMNRFLVNEVEAVHIEGSWQWIFHEYGLTLTLTVVPKDTLSFIINDEHDGRLFVTEGWIVPNDYAAEIITEWEHVRWNKDANGCWLTVGSMPNPLRSFISSSGQGWLAWEGYDFSHLSEIYFRAVWDGYGHGYYESSWGSGNW